ncbi:MAG: hypothetical protein WCI54_17255 [Bacteroidia bacterium]
MSIKLGNYSFSGPFESIEKIKDRSGVYAIVCKVDNEYFLSDVRESLKLRTRIENHYTKDSWKKNGEGQLTIYAHYTPLLNQKGRIRIEQELRELFHPDFNMDKKIRFNEGVLYYYE